MLSRLTPGTLFASGSDTLAMFSLGCFRNSADTEFRIFFLIPYIPYTIRNCSKFRWIMRNSVLRNSSNSAEFLGIPWLLVWRNSA